MANVSSFWHAWEPRVLSLLRIVTALVYLQYGLNKLFNFPPVAGHKPYVLMTLNPGLSGLIETIGGILVVLGLFTRPAAFIMSGEMAVAYFMVLLPRGFPPLTAGGNNAAVPILFCFVFFYLFVAGGGSWSLDRLLRGR